MSGALASIKSKASSGMNRAATAVGIQRTNTEDSNPMDELAEFCPQLTYQQRMIGFCTCFVLGYFITFASFRFFVDLIEGNPVPFVVLYCKLKVFDIESWDVHKTYPDYCFHGAQQFTH